MDTTVASPTAPSAVVLGAYNAKTKSVSMNWTDNSTDETGFRVEYSKDGGKTWLFAQQMGANVTSRDAWGVQPNATYQFRVCALRGEDRSDWAYSELLEPGVRPTQALGSDDAIESAFVVSASTPVAPAAFNVPYSGDYALTTSVAVSLVEQKAVQEAVFEDVAKTASLGALYSDEDNFDLEFEIDGDSTKGTFFADFFDDYWSEIEL